MKSSITSTGRMKGLLLATAAAAVMLGTASYAAEPAAENPAAQAATLKQQAAEYRARADRHEKMAAMHRGGGGSSKMAHENVVRHCESIAKNLRAAADESEALAEEYKKEAAR